MYASTALKALLAASGFFMCASCFAIPANTATVSVTFKPLHHKSLTMVIKTQANMTGLPGPYRENVHLETASSGKGFTSELDDRYLDSTPPLFDRTLVYVCRVHTHDPAGYELYYIMAQNYVAYHKMAIGKGINARTYAALPKKLQGQGSIRCRLLYVG